MGRLRESCEKRPIPRPLPKWEGVPAGEGQETEEVIMEFDFPQPIIVPPSAGKVLEFMGVTHKLTQPQTGGAFYLFEVQFEPETGNSLHVHRNEDEIVYVLEGAIQIRLDNQKLQAGAGGV